MLRLFLSLCLLFTAVAPAPASALTPPGQAQAEGQRSSNKYALGADPNTADWTQGSQLASGVQSASGDAFQNTASQAGTDQASGQSDAARVAAHVEDVAPASSSFVGTNGVHFTLDGNIRYFPGSNDYFLILRYPEVKLDSGFRCCYQLLLQSTGKFSTAMPRCDVVQERRVISHGRPRSHSFSR